MTNVALAIGLLALIGLFFVGVRLLKLQSTVSTLEHIHTSGTRVQINEKIDLEELKIGQEINSYIILGVKFTQILLDNQSNGEHIAEKEVIVEIPDETVHIVPLFMGFMRLFGEVTNRDLSNFEANVEDHHICQDYTSITGVINMRGKATIKARMLLRDKNADDSWCGAMGVVIFCLGYHPA